MPDATVSETKLVSPGGQSGLIDVFRRHYLLSLIIKKEVGLRYRGSIFGWLWSYVKPLVQFLVFFFALGVFMGMNRAIEFYPIYLLAGITVTTFFNEAFFNGTRSLIDNAALIKKIYFPRQMFPIASTLVALINTLPQILVVMIIAIFFGWSPSLLGVGAILLGLIIIALLATGLGMFFGAVNVTFRDAQSIVEIITMVSVWASPVMYKWTMVSDSLKDHAWLVQLYFLNPITVAVELFHYGLWIPLSPRDEHTRALETTIPDLGTHALIAVAVSIVVVVLGELTFRKLEGRFAQDL